MIPNMKTLIHVGCVLPITSCEAERSFYAQYNAQGEINLAGFDAFTSFNGYLT